MRVSGIAILGDDGWKIHAIAYARTMPDKELATRAIAATPGPAEIAGDATVAKLVAAWFVAGGNMAGDRSKNVAVAVTGTSPLELGTGAYAVNLVKAWDHLKLWATTVDATVFEGEAAFVRAEVWIPVKGQAAKLMLGVILVRENGVWRWVSLSFTPAD